MNCLFLREIMDVFFENIGIFLLGNLNIYYLLYLFLKICYIVCNFEKENIVGSLVVRLL